MDERLLLLVNGSHTTWLNDFMWYATGTLPWMLFFASLLWLVVKSNERGQTLFVLLCLALALILSDQLAASVIKPWVARLRPTHDPLISAHIHVVRGYVGGLYSFPSNHAANTVALTTFMSLLVRHRYVTLSCLTWALLSSYSRVYLGVHYPSDILCGALLGASLGVLMYYICWKVSLCRSVGRYSRTSRIHTSTGYLISDTYVVPAALLVTLIAMVF